MTKKKVPIKAKSKAKSPSKKAAEDAWVEGQASSTNSGETRLPDGQEQESGKMKRLTIDVSEDLHRRIKVGCAGRGVKMADEIRGMLEQEFGGDGGK